MALSWTRRGVKLGCELERDASFCSTAAEPPHSAGPAMSHRVRQRSGDVPAASEHGGAFEAKLLHATPLLLLGWRLLLLGWRLLLLGWRLLLLGWWLRFPGWRLLLGWRLLHVPRALTILLRVALPHHRSAS